MAKLIAHFALGRVENLIAFSIGERVHRLTTIWTKLDGNIGAPVVEIRAMDFIVITQLYLLVAVKNKTM